MHWLAPQTTPGFVAVSSVTKEELSNHSFVHCLFVHHSFFCMCSFPMYILSGSLYIACAAFSKPLSAVSALCQLLGLCLPCPSLIACSQQHLGILYRKCSCKVMTAALYVSDRHLHFMCIMPACISFSHKTVRVNINTRCSCVHQSFNCLQCLV